MRVESSLLTIDDSREVIDHVVEQVCAAVVSTMGPNGKLALIKNGVATKATKDGVTVARAISFPDQRSELVNRVITEPAIKTDAECGDGTTTTILLTAALYDVFKKFPSFVDQKRIEEIVLEIIKELTAVSIVVDVDDPRLYAMALTSSNQDVELAKTITNLYKESKGKFPEFELKEHFELEDKVQRTDGRVLKMVYSSPTFGKGQQGGEFVLDNYRAVVIDNRLSNLDGLKLQQTLDKIFQPGVETTAPAPLLIIARSIEQDVLSQIIAYVSTPANRYLSKDGVPAIIAMNTNMGGSIGSSQMSDLAVMLQAPVITDIFDMADVDIKTSTNTLTLGGGRSLLTNLQAEDTARIDAQIAEIEKAMSEYTLSDRFSLRARFNESRLRNLRGELITVWVGGETNSEVKERIDRYVDVVKAVKSGLVNGILPGAGVALMDATARVLNGLLVSDKVGPRDSEYKEALFEAMCMPYRQLMTGILDNATIADLHWENFDRPVVVNLATDEVGAPQDIGIFDTAFAAITALKGGLQTAKILANTKSLILGDKLFAVASTI